MNIRYAILEYLRSGKTLTGLEALSLFGTMKLSTRISELRAEGYKIEDETVHNEVTKKHYNKYWIAEPISEQEEEIIEHNARQEQVINYSAVGQQLSFI